MFPQAAVVPTGKVTDLIRPFHVETGRSATAAACHVSRVRAHTDPALRSPAAAVVRPLRARGRGSIWST